MTQRTPNRRTGVTTTPPDRESRRRRLLEVAAAEFAQFGFDEASMGRIALRAEIGKGTIYNYSGRKDQLFSDCLHLFCGELQQLLEEVASTIARLPLSQEAALTRIALISDRLTDLTLRRPDFVTLYFSVLFGVQPRGRDMVVSSAREVISVLEQLFLTGQDVGVVRADTPADLLAAFVFMNRVVYSRLLESLELQKSSRAERAAFLFEMHWRAIKTVPET